MAITWSERLGRTLLSALPAAKLASHWGVSPDAEEEKDGAALEQVRRDLLAWSERDEEMRHWVVKTWREEHAELVMAADQAIIEGFQEEACRPLRRFPADEALLAILTDEIDDGCELARTFVAGLTQVDQRRALNALLDDWLGEAGEPMRQRLRLVIIGGHPRDENVVGQRVFADSPFQVRWKAFEKRQSSGTIQREVVQVLRAADALLVITGMASHTLAQFARGFAARNDIPCRCVEKVTERRLKSALKEMFPERTVAWA